MDEDEERKGPGDQRPAPAEMLDQRNQKHRVGVPDPVGYHQGAERDGDHEPGTRVLRPFHRTVHPIVSLGGGFGRRGATTQSSAHEKQINATAPHMAAA
jgi:hypothetical protein